MSLHFWILFTLAGSVRSWLQVPEAADEADNAASLLSVGNVPASRSLPSFENDGLAQTLHIPTTELSGGIAKRKQSRSRGTLSLPVVHMPKPALSRLGIEVQLENRSDVAYYAQLDIGTPPQSIFAQIDTGSFELWVNPDCSGLSSSSDQDFCEAAGHYDPSDSETSKNDGESTTLNYGFGTAEIDYYLDSIALTDVPDSSLEKVRFGVASGTEDQFAGVLGLGYGDGINLEYRNFVDELAHQGVTETRAFSIGLGSKLDGDGVMVFGGVDTAKFGGKLAALPIIPAAESPDKVARYWVQMVSMSMSSSGSRGARSWEGANDLPVFLDTGGTLTLLPSSLVEDIAADFDSPGLDDAGYYTIDCTFVDEDGTVDFEFDGVTIRVPFREVIRKFNNGGSPSCYLGIAPSDKFALLGDTFLRAAYVVFDLGSDTIFMAQYEDCGTDVQTIESSTDLSDLQGTCGGGSPEMHEAEESATLSDSPSVSTSTNEAESTTSSSANPSTTSTSAATSSSATSSSEESLSSQTSPTSATTATTAGQVDETGAPSEVDSNNAGEVSDENEGNDNAASGLDSTSNAALSIPLGCMAIMVFL